MAFYSKDAKSQSRLRGGSPPTDPRRWKTNAKEDGVRAQGPTVRDRPAAAISGTRGVFKTSAKEDGVRNDGPAAPNSGKSMFPGVMPGTGDVAGQVPTFNKMKTRNYAGGRSEVQPREKGVRY